MALIRVTIEVEQLGLVMAEFDQIQIWRAETKWGCYKERTMKTTRIDLVADQEFYDYDDYDSSEYYWYKWRFYNSATTEVSRFSHPVQGYTPGTTYCTFADVKRILNSADAGKRIRFSDAYKNLRADEDNNDLSTINLKAISLGPSYAGQQPFEIIFNNTTEYTVYALEDDSYAPRCLGDGCVSMDFSANDNSVYIDCADWSGQAYADDKIIFQTASHMSIDDAIQFINNAEVLVDVIIESKIQYADPKDRVLRFARAEVPKAVRAAAERFAAFFIYSTIFNEQSMPGLPTQINDLTPGLRRMDDFATWPKQGMKYLEAYIQKYTELYDADTGDAVVGAPQWMAHDTLFDAVGVVGVGEGLKLPELNVFEDAQQSYDGLLDYDLLIPFLGSLE